MHSSIHLLTRIQVLLLFSLLLDATDSFMNIDMNVCSVTQSNMLSKVFTDNQVNYWDSSNCPESIIWKAHLYNEDGPKDRVYINAGVNKGYNFGEILAAFAPWTRIHTGRWKEAISHKSIEYINGACNEGVQFGSQLEHIEKALRVSKHPRIHLIGIDLNEENIKLVKAVIDKFKKKFPKEFRNVSTNLIYAKVSSTDKTNVSVPICEEGYESCGHGHQTNTATTNSIALDTLVSKFLNNSIKFSPEMKIDVIQIDTEGHDPQVLQGMTNILLKKQARVIIFEYHSIGEWKTTRLQDVVSKFAEYNYFCYFEGLHGRLWPISGSCWSDLYEFHHWSNVACFDVSDSFYLAIQRFIVREVPPDM